MQQANMCNCNPNITEEERHLQQVVLEIPESLEKQRRVKAGLSTKVCIDPCIVEEIKYLWQQGVTTNGCCCGHNKPGWPCMVNVYEESAAQMEALGYLRVNNPDNPNTFYLSVPENINKELIEKTTSVLDKIMAFFRKVVNRTTITDKGILHHAGEMEAGVEVFQDEELTTPVETDEYISENGEIITVMRGKVLLITSGIFNEHHEDFRTLISIDQSVDIKLREIKAKLHAQNILLNNARIALEEANARLKKT